jgi:Predicted hydrolase (metallo-beta-lactamase superfamily)
MSAKSFCLTVLNIPDVGRGVGLAIVLQTPGGRTYLYDAGTGYPTADGWERRHNSGRDVVAPWLQARGIDHLDGVIISHAHYDHFGGLLWLVDHWPIARLIDNGYEFAGPRDEHYAQELSDYAELRERFRARHAYQAVQAGDTLDLDPSLRVEVLSPPSDFFCEPHPERRAPENPAAHYMLNANSLMLRIVHGRVRFVLPGDIEREDQLRFMLPSIPAEKLACDILVAPGHGLHSAPELAEVARPGVTIASLFPRWLDHCTAKRVFARDGGRVYVTGEHGDVTVTSDGETWRVEASRDRV